MHTYSYSGTRSEEAAEDIKKQLSSRNFCPARQLLYPRKEATRKPKKSNLEDLQKTHFPVARALFEQYKIILLDSY